MGDRDQVTVGAGASSMPARGWLKIAGRRSSVASSGKIGRNMRGLVPALRVGSADRELRSREFAG